MDRGSGDVVRCMLERRGRGAARMEGGVDTVLMGVQSSCAWGCVNPLVPNETVEIRMGKAARSRIAKQIDLLGNASRGTTIEDTIG